MYNKVTKYGIYNGEKVKLYPYAWEKNESNFLMLSNMFEAYENEVKPCIENYAEDDRNFKDDLYTWNFVQKISARAKAELAEILNKSIEYGYGYESVIWVPYAELKKLKDWQEVAELYRQRVF